MGTKSESLGVHHRRFDLRGLDGFAAAILLKAARRMAEIGLKGKGK
jgi:hypothetical protein